MELTNEITIKNLSDKRQDLFNKYNESYDEEISEHTEEYPKEIDELGDEILGRIKLWKNSLSVEFILEELSKLGYATCLLYDDEGHWAISTDGVQTVVIGDPVDVSMNNFVEKDMWKDTIREAINYYLDIDEKD